MGRKIRDSGLRWEREAAKLLSKFSGEWKRVPGSGSLGMQNGSLKADITGRYPWFSKPIRAEAKFGYGGNKQLTLHREWIDKIIQQASEVNAIPCLLLKFRDVYSGDRSAKLIVFDFETWQLLMKDLETLWDEYIKYVAADYERRDS